VVAIMGDRLGDLTAAGVAIWLDDLSRTRLADGSLARLIRNCHVVGVTTNPTIFHKAISGGDHYDQQIHDLAARGVTAEEALRMITAFDVRWACDVLREVHNASGGADGWVSIEVEPGSQTTPRRRSPKPASCGGWWTGPTCSSRFPGRSPGCRRSPGAWARASTSM
jgi:transaldolase